jgi:signal peptidase
MSHPVASAVFILAALLLLWPAQFGGITGLTLVNGASMNPTFHTGDLVVSVRLPAYQPGQIVSYLVPAGEPGAGGRVIHRIFSVDSEGIYTTKGDNNPDVDPWHFRSADALGTAIFALPGIGIMLGGLSSPLVMGVAFGLLVTLLLWRKPSRRSAT